MALSTFVYIRDVENLSDARYCAGMGADLIGFRLDDRLENSLNESTFREISNWISGVKIVGEFGQTPQDKVHEVLANSTVDYLLVPEVSLLNSYASYGKPLILQLAFNDNIDDQLSALNYITEEFDYLLITSKETTINKSHNSIIKDLSSQYSVLLGFGVNEQNAMNLIEEFGIEGISLTGGSEIRPGFKDYDALADVLEVLEVD